MHLGAVFGSQVCLPQDHHPAKTNGCTKLTPLQEIRSMDRSSMDRSSMDLRARLRLIPHSVPRAIPAPLTST